MAPRPEWNYNEGLPSEVVNSPEGVRTGLGVGVGPGRQPPPPVEPVEEQGWVGDTVDALQSGSWGILGDVAGGIPQIAGRAISNAAASEVVPSYRFGKAIAEAGEDIAAWTNAKQDENRATMSARGQEAISKRWLSDENQAWKDPYALWLQLMQTAPSAAATMAPGIGVGLRAGKVAGAVAGGISEAGLVAGGTATDIQSRIDQESGESLRRIPGASEFLRKFPNATDDELKTLLKMTLIPESSMMAGAAAGALGGVGMGALLSQIMESGGQKLWKRFAKGYATEFIQESLQEGSQASITEKALTGEWFNHEVAERAIQGGALGGIFGGSAAALLGADTAAAASATNPDNVPPQPEPSEPPPAPDPVASALPPWFSAEHEVGPQDYYGPTEGDLGEQLGPWWTGGPTDVGPTPPPPRPDYGEMPRRSDTPAGRQAEWQDELMGVTPSAPSEPAGVTMPEGMEGATSPWPQRLLPKPSEEPSPKQPAAAPPPDYSNDLVPERPRNILAQLKQMLDPKTKKKAVYISGATLEAGKDPNDPDSRGVLQQYLEDVLGTEGLQGAAYDEKGLNERGELEAATAGPEAENTLGRRPGEVSFWSITDDKGGVLVTTDLKLARKYGAQAEKGDVLTGERTAASDVWGNPQMWGSGEETRGMTHYNSLDSVAYNEDNIAEALGYTQSRSEIDNLAAASLVIKENANGDVVDSQLVSNQQNLIDEAVANMESDLLPGQTVRVSSVAEEQGIRPHPSQVAIPIPPEPVEPLVGPMPELVGPPNPFEPTEFVGPPEQYPNKPSDKFVGPPEQYPHKPSEEFVGPKRPVLPVAPEPTDVRAREKAVAKANRQIDEAVGGRQGELPLRQPKAARRWLKARETRQMRRDAALAKNREIIEQAKYHAEQEKRRIKGLEPMEQGAARRPHGQFTPLGPVSKKTGQPSGFVKVPPIPVKYRVAEKRLRAALARLAAQGPITAETQAELIKELLTLVDFRRPLNHSAGVYQQLVPLIRDIQDAMNSGEIGPEHALYLIDKIAGGDLAITEDEAAGQFILPDGPLKGLVSLVDRLSPARLKSVSKELPSDLRRLTRMILEASRDSQGAPGFRPNVATGMQMQLFASEEEAAASLKAQLRGESKLRGKRLRPTKAGMAALLRRASQMTQPSPTQQLELFGPVNEIEQAEHRVDRAARAYRADPSQANRRKLIDAQTGLSRLEEDRDALDPAVREGTVERPVPMVNTVEEKLQIAAFMLEQKARYGVGSPEATKAEQAMEAIYAARRAYDRDESEENEAALTAAIRAFNQLRGGHRADVNTESPVNALYWIARLGLARTFANEDRLANDSERPMSAKLVLSHMDTKMRAAINEMKRSLRRETHPYSNSKVPNWAMPIVEMVRIESAALQAKALEPNHPLPDLRDKMRLYHEWLAKGGKRTTAAERAAMEVVTGLEGRHGTNSFTTTLQGKQDRELFPDLERDAPVIYTEEELTENEESEEDYVEYAGDTRGETGRAGPDRQDGVSRPSPVLESVIQDPETQDWLNGGFVRLYGGPSLQFDPEQPGDVEQVLGIRAALAHFKSGAKQKLSFLINDGTGFGKTVQQLVIANELLKREGGKALIVAKSAYQIDRTFKRDAERLGIDFTGGDFDTISYDQLGKTEITGEYTVVIFDEAHHLATQNTQSVNAANLNTKYQLFATATPVTSPAGMNIVAQMLNMNLGDFFQSIGLSAEFDEKDAGSDKGIKREVDLQVIAPGTWTSVLRRLSAVMQKLSDSGAMVARSFDRKASVRVISLDRMKSYEGEPDVVIRSKSNTLTLKPGEAENYLATLLDSESLAADKSTQLSFSDGLSELSKVGEMKRLIKEALAAGKRPIIMLERTATPMKRQPGSSKLVREALKPYTVNGPDGKVKIFIPPAMDVLIDWLKSEGHTFSEYHGATQATTGPGTWQAGGTEVLLVTFDKGGAGIDLDDQGDIPNRSAAGQRVLVIPTRPTELWKMDQIYGRVERKTSESVPEIYFLESNFYSDDNRTDRALDSEEVLNVIHGRTGHNTALVPTATLPAEMTPFDRFLAPKPGPGGTTKLTLRGVRHSPTPSKILRTALTKLRKRQLVVPRFNSFVVQNADMPAVRAALEEALKRVTAAQERAFREFYSATKPAKASPAADYDQAIADILQRERSGELSSEAAQAELDALAEKVTPAEPGKKGAKGAAAKAVSKKKSPKAAAEPVVEADSSTEESSTESPFDSDTFKYLQSISREEIIALRDAKQTPDEVRTALDLYLSWPGSNPAAAPKTGTKTGTKAGTKAAPKAAPKAAKKKSANKSPVSKKAGQQRVGTGATQKLKVTLKPQSAKKAAVTPAEPAAKKAPAKKAAPKAEKAKPKTIKQRKAEFEAKPPQERAADIYARRFQQKKSLEGIAPFYSRKSDTEEGNALWHIINRRWKLLSKKAKDGTLSKAETAEWAELQKVDRPGARADAASDPGFTEDLAEASEAVGAAMELGADVRKILNALRRALPSGHAFTPIVDAINAALKFDSDIAVELVDTLNGRAAEIDLDEQGNAVRIRVARDKSASRRVKAVLHEMVHAATVRNLLANPQLRARLEKLMDAARLGGLEQAYGLTNVEEFVAEAFSSPQFREALRQIDAPSSVRAFGFGRDLWTAMVNLVRKFLKLPPQAQSLLDAIMDESPDLFRDATRLEPGVAVRTLADDGATGPMTDYLREFGTNLRNASGGADRASIALRGIAKLPLMTTRQIIKGYGHLFRAADGSNPVQRWFDGLYEKEVLVRKFQTKGYFVYRKWEKLAASDGKSNTIVSKLMGDATTYDIWPDRPITAPENSHLLYSNKKDAEGNRIPLAPERVEANKAKHAELADIYNSLPAEWQQLFGEVATYYANDFQQSIDQLLDNVLDIYTFGLVKEDDTDLISETGITNRIKKDFAQKLRKDPKLVRNIVVGNRGGLKAHADGTLDYSSVDGKATNAVHEQLRHILRSGRVVGPYFPLRRFGDHVVEATRNEATKSFSESELTEAELKKADSDATAKALSRIKKLEKQRGVTLSEAEKADVLAQELANMRAKALNRRINEWKNTLYAENRALQFDPAEQTANGVTVKYRERTVSFHEHAGKARQAIDVLNEDGWTVTGPGGGTAKLKREYLRLQGNISPSLLAAAKRRVPPGVDNSRLTNLLEAAFVEILPETSVRKAEMRRRKVAGYSDDMMRAFASHVKAHSHYMAGLKMSREITDALSQIHNLEKEMTNSLSQGDAYRMAQVRAELDKREALDAMGPETHEWVANVSAMGFLWYLTSISYNLVNATQPTLIGLPWLSARSGDASAAAAMKRAYGAIGGDVLSRAKATGFGFGFVSGKNGRRVPMEVFDFITNDEGGGSLSERLLNSIDNSNLADKEGTKAMLMELARKGLIDMTFAADMASVAEGRSGVRERIMEWARVMPHLTEVLNRAVMATAAYEVGIKQGMSPEKATEFAELSVEETQFDYSLINKPRYMSQRQSPALAPLMMFMQHPQHIYYLMLRDTLKSFKGMAKLARNRWDITSLTPAELEQVRRETKEAGATIMGISAAHLLAAGAIGGLFEPAKWMLGLGIAMFGAMDDEPPRPTNDVIREVLANTFGKEAGEVMAKGLPSLVGLDLSSRLGMSDMLFYSGGAKQEGREYVESVVFDALGPMGAVAGNMAEGVKHIRDGDLMRGFEMLSPKVIRDAVRAGRFATEGIKDTYGNTIQDQGSLTPYDLFLQSIGFNPAKVTEVAAARGAVKNVEMYYATSKKRFFERWARAETPREKERVWSDIRAFNEEFPRTKWITKGSLLKSTQERARRDRMRGDKPVYTSRKDRYLQDYLEPYNL